MLSRPRSKYFSLPPLTSSRNGMHGYRDRGGEGIHRLGKTSGDQHRPRDKAHSISPPSVTVTQSVETPFSETYSVIVASSNSVE